MKTLILVFSMAFASSSFAFVRTGVDKIKSPQTLEKQAQKEGVGISREERSLKNEIIVNKKKDKKAFEALVDDSLATPPYYQSYLLEVRDGLSQIEKAKVLAKFTILNQVRQNKDFMFKSILNRHAGATWDEAEYYIKRDINEGTVYAPSKTTKDYQFETADWGRVSVAADLKTAKWHVDIASRFDDNKLEPFAKDIKIDSEGGDSLVPEEAAPVVPTLSQLDKKAALEKASLKPKLKK